MGKKWPGVWPLLAVLLVATAQGCGGGSAPLLNVTGKVSYKGAPVPGGTIVFTPDTSRGSHGDIAMGQIHADGSYALHTGDVAGVAPGHYRVTVASFSPTPSVVGQPFAIPQSLLPERYRDPELSMLSCEIKGDRPLQFDFQLD